MDKLNFHCINLVTQVVNGAALKMLCESFVGSNPTLGTIKLDTPQLTYNINFIIIKHNMSSDCPSSSVGRAQAF